MKKHSTPKSTMNSKITCKLTPKQSTIDFIMGFAASYEPSKVLKGKFPGFVLN